MNSLTGVGRKDVFDMVCAQVKKELGILIWVLAEICKLTYICISKRTIISQNQNYPILKKKVRAFISTIPVFIFEENDGIVAARNVSRSSNLVFSFHHLSISINSFH